MQTNKLTPNISSLMNGYMIPSNPYVPHESLLMDVLMNLAQIAGHYRLQIQTGKDEYFCNIYGIKFMPSGAGKDRPFVNFRKVFMGDYFDMFNIEMNKHVESGTEEDPHRRFARMRSDATSEGFLADRAAMVQAGFGGSFIKISEFADYITSQTNSRGEFLSTLIESYDFGSNESKATRKDADFIEIEGIPSNALLMSSLAGVLDGNRYGNDKLMSFFNRGAARRCFVCYPQIPEMKNSKEKYIAGMLDNNKGLDPIINDFNSIINGVMSVLKVSNTVTLEDESMLWNYHYDCIREAEDKPESLRLEILSRPFRALRLCGIIHLFESYDSFGVVSAYEYESAKYITELYGVCYARFFADNNDVIRVYNYLLEYEGDFLTTMDIRQLGMTSSNRFRTWWDTILPEIQDLAYANGYILRTEDHGKSGKKYSIVTKQLDEALSNINLNNEF